MIQAKSLFFKDLVFLRVILSVAMIFHGHWNLSDEGILWWKSGEQVIFPWYFCFPAALSEFMIAASFLLNRVVKAFAFMLALLMVFAIYMHLPMGYSFKVNGYETPLCYLFMSLELFFYHQNRSEN